MSGPRRPARTVAAMLCALLLAACTGLHGSREPAPGAATFSVVTLNLYHDKADWPRRRVQIARTLRELAPDVVALQEVLQTEDLRNQAEWLAAELGCQVHFTSTDPAGSARRFGNALLTPHRILARGERALQPHDDFRAAAMLRIEVHGRPVDVYATHLHWTDGGGAIRARQVDDLLDFIATASGDHVPVVVAGTSTPKPAHPSCRACAGASPTASARCTRTPGRKPPPSTARGSTGRGASTTSSTTRHAWCRSGRRSCSRGRMPTAPGPRTTTRC